MAAAGSVVYVQDRANHALRQEVAALRNDLRVTLASIKAENTKSARAQSSDVATASVVAALPGTANEELAKLRDEIVSLRKSTTTLTQFAQAAQAVQAAQALAKSTDSVATQITPASQLKNAGWATPAASTETALWAAVGGDVEMLASTLMFTESARAKADAWFAGLSDGTRQQYGSPEKVIALMIARDAAGLSGMQILGEKEVTPNDVGVRLRFASVDGKTKDDTLLMHRATDGWRMLIPDNALEKFARQIGGGK